MEPQITAEIIAIGTEILLGDIVNTNASYIARELASIGINTYHQQVVGDNPDRVLDAFSLAFGRSQVVITTGGLGPTGDDLSKEMGAQYFGVPLKEDRKARENIETSLSRRGIAVTPNNWKQALLPEGSTALYNEHGTAPGFILSKDGKTLIMLPGPPSEMRPMFDGQVKPYLASLTRQVMVSRTLHICGIGESSIEYSLHEMMEKMSNPTLAPYAKTGTVDLRITARAETGAEAEAMIRPVEGSIRERFGTAVFGADGDTLEGVVGQMLLDRGMTVTTAESCTGGLIAGRLINYPGISGAYRSGFITYSNEAKERLLGVKKETLAAYGAVSEQTAREMAEGAAFTAEADAAIAVTGIAGPGGGSADKPVGLVYVGIYVKGRTRVHRFQFTKSRQENREGAVVAALNALRLAILEADAETQAET